MTRKKRTIMQDFGRRASASRHILPSVAIHVATMAANGEIEPDDAAEYYTTYFKAAADLAHIDPTSPTVKVQISKLRKIIQAADPQLLHRVSDMHFKLHRKEPCKPLYHAMVDVCRFKLSSGRTTISDTAIKRLLLRP